MRLLVALSIAFLCAPLDAQTLTPDTTGTSLLVGTVTDSETGEPLIGANIVLPEMRRGAATDIDGHYVVRRIPAGTYEVRVSYAGYLTTIIPAVEIGDNRTVTMHIDLEVNTDVEWTHYHCYPPPLVQNTIYASTVVLRFACDGPSALISLAFPGR